MTPAPEALLASVPPLAPLVAEHRERLDRERELSAPLVDALVDGGYLRMFAPTAMGGSELEPVQGLRVIAALSELDGSVGWNAMIAGLYSFFAGRLPAAAAEKIFGDRRAAVAGALTPNASRAEVRGDGYRVRGRWPFGSGCKQATWFLGQCFIHEDGAPRPGRMGLPEMRLVFAPAEQCEIHDTWNVSGLRGTGSHDYSMEVDVSADFCFDLLLDEPTRPETLYQFPAFPLLTAGVAAVPVGIARAALRAFVEIAKTKRSLPSMQLLAEHQGLQGELARAEILARSAEQLLFRAVEDLWETTRAGDTPSLEQRAEVRLGCINAGSSAAQAVDIVYDLAGSASIFEKHPIERCFRDVHAATQHMAVSKKTLEVPGRVFLGLEPQGLI